MVALISDVRALMVPISLLSLVGLIDAFIFCLLYTNEPFHWGW